MLVVHHLGISQSDRIVWLCEELGIEYQLKRYERHPVNKMAPPEYRALHPFGTAPVITDGDIVLGESGAIIEYIITKYGRGRLALKPSDAGYADYLFWYHFANGSFMPVLMMDGLITSPEHSGIAGAMHDRTVRAYDSIETYLGKSDYFAGAAFSAADIMMVFPLTTMRAFAPRDLAAYPNIRRYLQRIAGREAFKRAMSKADPGFKIPLE